MIGKILYKISQNKLIVFCFVLKTLLPHLFYTEGVSAVKGYLLLKAKDYFLCEKEVNSNLYFT